MDDGGIWELDENGYEEAVCMSTGLLEGVHERTG